VVTLENRLYLHFVSLLIDLELQLPQTIRVLLGFMFTRESGTLRTMWAQLFFASPRWSTNLITVSNTLQTAASQTCGCIL